MALSPAHFHAYRRSQKFLEALPQQVFMPRSVDPALGLQRTQALLDLLGNPERGFRYVHVTGTAGKGTVVAGIAAALHAAGERVGTFTSPHVTTTLERITVGAKLTSVQDFLWAFAKVQKAIRTLAKKFQPSHFEALFAMALLIFQKRKIQWAVIEVAAGGKNDPTNIIRPPKLAIITAIGMDHERILGRTRKAITRAKAGIIKPGCTVITGVTEPKLLGIIQQQARQARAKVTVVRPSTKLQVGTLRGPASQLDAAIIQAACQFLQLKPEVIQTTLRHLRLPARVERMPDRLPVIIDGSHNQLKAQALVAALRTQGIRKVKCIIGITAHKKPQRILRPLLPIVTGWFRTASSQPYPPALQPRELANALRALGTKKRTSMHHTSLQAFRSARRSATPADAILITGSFYLAGELRQMWYAEREIVEQRSSFPKK
jgi:dihydrofolate synthase/folylpolyglutamate synthase